jgi:hypothetical protein
LESQFDPGVLLLDGPNVRFTSADQLLSRVLGRREAKAFSVRFEMRGKNKVELTYKKVEGKGFEIESMEYSGEEGAWRISEQLTQRQIVDMFHGRLRGLPGRPKTLWLPQVYRERCFLAIRMELELTSGQRVRVGPPEFCSGTMITPEIEGLIHVPGLRGNPERTYKTSSVGPNFPGTFEHYVASVISKWQASDKAALEQLGAWLDTLGLTWKVDARSVDDTHVELQVGRLSHSRRGGAQDMVNVADAGLGLSQVLPVLVALLAARPGQLVYLEQPEIHLHPLAQRRLAGVLAAAAQRGIRLVVETHSELLLREIQTLVAKGQLAPDLVKLHWFKRDPQDGVTALSTADLDQNGAFGNWPEDFGEVHLGAEKDYLDAVEEKAAPS